MKTPIEYIKEAWRIYTKKENFLFFARIMAVLTVVSTVISYFHAYISQFAVDPKTFSISFDNPLLAILSILIALFSFLFYFYSQSTIYSAILNIGLNEKDVFKLGYTKKGKFFFTSLVFWLIILLGMILLVVPMVIFGVWYSFAVFLAMDKNLNVRDSLKRSKLMVKNKFFKVLGRFVVFGLFLSLVSIFLSSFPYVGLVISQFVTPLFILPYLLLYRDLSKTS